MPASRIAASLWRKLALLGVVISAVAASPAHAGITFDLTQVGDMRVTSMTMTGSFNTAALGDFLGTSNSSFSGASPFSGSISSTGGSTGYYAVNLQAWTPFGNGGLVSWNSASGDAVALFGDPVLGLPSGYQSGASLFATASVDYYLGDIGLAPGSYVNTLTNNGVSDTITINIRQVAAVPEPQTYAMLLTGLVAIAVTARRRKK